MNHYGKSRKAIALLKNPPRIHTWAANKEFNRTKKKKYGDLVQILMDDSFLSFCAAVGWIGVNWSIYENQVLGWCQIMFVKYKWHGVGRSVERRIPVSYSRKVRFVRSGFAGIPALRRFSSEGIEILERAEELSTTREGLMHAVITHLESREGKYFLEMRDLDKTGRHTVRDVVFDSREFPKLSRKFVVLGRDAIHFSARLQDELP